MSKSIYPHEHAAKVAAQRSRGEQLALAVDIFRGAWQRANAEGRAGSRVKAGLRLVLLPVLVERDEAEAKLAAAEKRLAAVEKLAEDWDLAVAIFHANGLPHHAAPYEITSRQLRNAIA